MVLERARSHLKVLSELAIQLNEVSDRYTDELKAIEAELQRMNLGLEVYLDRPLKETDYEEAPKDERRYAASYYYAWTLGHGKGKDDGGLWRLLVYHYRVIEDEGGGRTWRLLGTIPLLEASRELRLCAAEQILDLLTKLGREARKKIDAVQRVCDTVSPNGIPSDRFHALPS